MNLPELNSNFKWQRLPDNSFQPIHIEDREFGFFPIVERSEVLKALNMVE